MTDTRIVDADKTQISSRKFGKYEVESVLGEGGMGVVYKCFDPDLQRHVAVKTIHKELLQGELGAELLTRFRNEMLATSKLAHQNIVTVFDAGMLGDTPYFVMEYVDGRELSQYLKEGVRFPLHDSLKIITQVLTGLAYTHNHGVIHRDLKPANIFITNTGSAKIADFGIAKLESSELTKVGAVLGSPRYMSPEQCVGEAVDNRSDLFSAGILFYELLTGEHCFNANASHTVIHKIINTTPEAPSLLNPALPKLFDTVLAKALAKKPQDRYQTAEEFIAAIRKAEAALKPDGKKIRKLWPFVSGAMVLTVILAGAWWFWPQRPPETASNQLQPSSTNSSAVTPAPSPAPLVTPSPLRQVEVLSPEKADKIQRLLKVAQAHMMIGRLVSPSGSNAYDAYQIVLSIDPNNADAKAGIEQVKQKLLQETQSFIEQGDQEQARAAIEAGLSVFPNEPELTLLQQKLATNKN